MSLSEKQRGGVTLKDFYIRRGRRVLPAYWLVVGGYSLLLVLAGRIPPATALWSMSTLHYWFHIPGAFNWYIPALLAFYLLAPGYVGIFERCRHREWLTAAMFPAAYGLYRIAVILGIHYTEDFINRIPAFALGVLAGNYVCNDRPLTGRQTAVWTAGCLCGIAGILLRMQNRLYISPCYLIAAFLMPVCLLVAWGISYLGRAGKTALRVLGENSLEIYLLNVIVTREFDLLAPYLDRGPRHLFYYALVYGANLLLGIGLHWVLNRLHRHPTAAGLH